MKVYVLDTTALMDDPNIVKRLSGKVVIPISVIRQLDYLKNDDDKQKAKRARWASRVIDEATVAKNTSDFEIVHEYENTEGLSSDADNKIVGTALKLKRDGHNVSLITSDINMRSVARSYGINAPGTKKRVINRENVKFFPFDIAKELFKRHIANLRVIKTYRSGVLLEVPSRGQRGYIAYVNAVNEIEIVNTNKGLLKKVANFFFD